MQKINYSLILTDFDGTLARKDGTVASETLEAIENYKRAGGHFAISSGRMLSSILPIAKKMGLTGLVAAFQGTVVADIESGELVVDGAMEQNEALEICRILEEMGLHVHAYETECFYSNVDDDLLAYYRKIVSEAVIIVKDEPLFKFLARKDMRIRKLVVMVYPDQRDGVYKQLVERFGDKYYVTCSAPILVEISNPNYTKATSLEKIAQYYGVPMEKTIAVGDNLNDLPMIERAGLGIAVANAEAELKARADVAFVFTNDENAIGEIIREYGFEKN